MIQNINYENLIVILYLFNRSKLGGGRMKTAKLLYLFEDDLYKNKIIGSTYVMKRYPMGPYNPNIANDLKILGKNGFLKIKERYFDKIDDFVDVYFKNYRTTKFLKSVEGFIQENSEIFDKLDLIADIYSKKKGDELKDYIYSLKNTGWKNQRIYNYSEGEIILNPKKIENPTKIFQLDEEWYDTVEIMLDREIFYNFQKGIKDAQQGNFTNELS